MPDIPTQNTLPPPSDTTSQQWVTYLNQHPVYAADLMQFRYGYLARTPLESSKNILHRQYLQVPVPHPQSKHYTMIEMAKRNREEAIRKSRLQQRVKIHGVYQSPPWVPPQEHPDLLRFCPNINHFQKGINIRLPKWVI
jgi:hypothetical protein